MVKRSTNSAQRGFESQRQGDAAADQVKHWASQAGFVVNESQRDRRGWDHCYEFFAPSSDQAKIPPGMPFGALSCKVQVRSTANRSKVARIKLSNLLVFSQEPIPCFIAVLKIDRKTRQLKNVYLMHVWEEVIGQALERICKLTPTQRKNLHKTKISLPLQLPDQLSEPWSASLHDRITTNIGSDLFDYAQRKRTLYETLGFGQNNREFKVTFKAPSAEEIYERLSSLAVGLESMEFVRFEGWQTRFGIKFSEQKINPERAGLLQIQPTEKDRAWILRVFERDLSNPVELRCTVRSSAQAFPFLPEQYSLLRIQTSLLDLLARTAINQMTFSFNLPTPAELLTLQEWYQTCKLLERLNSTSGETMLFRITREEKEARSFDFSITSPGVSLPDTTRDLIKVVKATELVARNLEFDLSTGLSLLDLSSIYPEVFLLESVVARLTVRVEVVLPGQVKAARKSAIVTFPTLKFGQRQYVFAVAILGFPVVRQLDSGDTGVTIESTEINVLQRWVHRSDEADTFSVDTAVEGATRILEERGIEDIFFVQWAELRRPA